MDPLSAFYLFCFLFGLLFTLTSFALGWFHLPSLAGGHRGGIHFHHVGAPGHGGGAIHHGSAVGRAGGPAQHGSAMARGGGPAHHGGGPAHHGAVGDEETTVSAQSVTGDQGSHRSGGGSFSPINVSTIMAFLTWFGGVGFGLRQAFGILAGISLLLATLAGLAGATVLFFFLARILVPGQSVMDPADYELEGTVAQVTIPIRENGLGEILYSKGGVRHSDGARGVDGQAIPRDTEVVMVGYDRGIAIVEPWTSFLQKGRERRKNTTGQRGAA